jgi:hypothetical protein
MDTAMQAIPAIDSSGLRDSARHKFSCQNKNAAPSLVRVLFLLRPSIFRRDAAEMGGARRVRQRLPPGLFRSVKE